MTFRARHLLGIAQLAPDEITTLRTVLDRHRVTLRRQTTGLDGEQLAVVLAPSTMTLGGLVKHLTFVENYWFQWVLHGRAPSGIWADVDWEADPDWDWHSADEHTPASTLSWWWVAARSTPASAGSWCT